MLVGQGGEAIQLNTFHEERNMLQKQLTSTGASNIQVVVDDCVATMLCCDVILCWLQCRVRWFRVPCAVLAVLY